MSEIKTINDLYIEATTILLQMNQLKNWEYHT